MLRRLLRILSAISAALALIVFAVSARACFVGDAFAAGRWDAAAQTYQTLRVGLRADYFVFAWQRTVPGPSDMPLVRIRIAMSPGPHFEHETTGPSHIGFDDWVWWNHYLDQPSAGGSQEVRLIQVRPWLILLALAALPAVRMILGMRRRRARRHARLHGLCERCGYDLRGAPGRCPECGTEPWTPPPPASATPASASAPAP